MLPHELFKHVRASCLVLAATLAPLASVWSQGHATVVRVAVGFGVDTTTGPNREVFALWRSYLSSRPDSVRPTLLWSRSEQDQWPYFDLLRSYVYQGFAKFTVVDLVPAIGLDSTYLIRTLVASVADSSQDVKPLALYRVYATREQGRGGLREALPRLQPHWYPRTIGPSTFVFPRPPSFARARAPTTAPLVE